MKESFWGAAVIGIGMISIVFIFLFQTLTNTDEQSMSILKETTKAAMYDSFDLAAYRSHAKIRIDREKFVENFVRRFAENVSLTNTYLVEIYDVNEEPPKVSIKVSTNESGKLLSWGGGDEQTINFTISNTLDAILETPY